ncbi:MAG: hypothetical protein ACRDQA_28510 [Nocardioidaceae bacterium]
MLTVVLAAVALVAIVLLAMSLKATLVLLLRGAVALALLGGLAAAILLAPTVASPHATTTTLTKASYSVFHTDGAALRIRQHPGTASRTVGELRPGAHAVVLCWIAGSPVNDDPIWFGISRPHHGGFVSGYYLATPWRTSTDLAAHAGTPARCGSDAEPLAVG